MGFERNWGGEANELYGPNHFNRPRFSKDCAGIINTGGQVGVPRNHPDPSNCARHNGGNIIVFTDGHAKWERWDQSKSSKTLPSTCIPSSHDREPHAVEAGGKRARGEEGREACMNRGTRPQLHAER